jgi:hypothetical protein
MKCSYSRRCKRSSASLAFPFKSHHARVELPQHAERPRPGRGQRRGAGGHRRAHHERAHHAGVGRRCSHNVEQVPVAGGRWCCAAFAAKIKEAVLGRAVRWDVSVPMFLVPSVSPGGLLETHAFPSPSLEHAVRSACGARPLTASDLAPHPTCAPRCRKPGASHRRESTQSETPSQLLTDASLAALSPLASGTEQSPPRRDRPGRLSRPHWEPHRSAFRISRS